MSAGLLPPARLSGGTAVTGAGTSRVGRGAVTSRRRRCEVGRLRNWSEAASQALFVYRRVFMNNVGVENSRGQSEAVSSCVSITVFLRNDSRICKILTTAIRRRFN